MSSRRHESRTHSSRRSPDRHRRDSRRSSPEPSRIRSSNTLSKADRLLPEQFGRIPEKKVEDNNTVLQAMKKSFVYNPLGCLTKCIGGTQKLKVWTRNYKEVRGICTGFVVAFDKHWNMVLKDVNEVYLKPRKSKTPYLCDIKAGESLPELLPKVPKKKKEAAKEGEDQPKVVEPPKAAEAEGEVKKKKKKKKKTSQAANRFMKQCFIRGDNIVMVAVVKETEEAAEETEDEASREVSKET